MSSSFVRAGFQTASSARAAIPRRAPSCVGAGLKPASFRSWPSSCAAVGLSHPRYPDSTHNQAPQMAPIVQARPEWLPDEFEHEQITRQEVWDALDRDARRHFGLTADEFLHIYKDPPGRYHGDVIYRSLTYLARLLDQPRPDLAAARSQNTRYILRRL